MNKSILQLLADLTDPKSRVNKGRDLAVRLGAKELSVWITDQRTGLYTPAQGFPKTIPQGAKWQTFFEECKSSGCGVSVLPYPGFADPVSANVIYDESGAFLVLLGGTPYVADVSEIRLMLKVLGELFLRELEIAEADAKVLISNSLAEKAEFSAKSIDSIRLDLSQALIKAREVENKLRISKEVAEKANRSKTDFLAKMSHEIRTPMNVIVGITELLQRGLVAVSQQPEYLDTLSTSADQLLELIDDLLDVAKIESGDYSLKQVPFTFIDVIEEVLAIRHSEAEAKGIDLIVDKAPSSRLYLGDPLRLRQILLNIIGNAIKFTDKGMVAISFSDKDLPVAGFTGVEMIVKDTGIGIPSEKIDEIFEKFSQADNSTTRQYGGSGLGLSIVKALVDKMGGEIFVKSEVGNGTEFTIRLALASAETFQDPQPIHGPPLDIKNRKVLLVEDYTPNVLVASSMITSFGAKVDLASNGEEAVQKYLHNRFDVILMDIQMPEMDGLDATKAIRLAENEQERTPIIGMTAYAMEGDKQRCIDAGMDDYISKPFTLSKLSEVIGRVLQVTDQN